MLPKSIQEEIENLNNITNFKSRNVIRIEDNNFILIKGSFYQEEITSLNSYSPNKKVLSDIKN